MSPRSKKTAMKNSAAVCLYVLHLMVLAVSGEEVTGSVNSTLLLPCTYTERQHPMCWGRGGCPYSGCNDEILRTDGQKVTWRKSDRYQLLGKITQGDVSLTITGVTKEDEGTYCCRVEVSGPFNDQKKELAVKIVAENPTISETSDSDTHSTTTPQSMEATHNVTSAPVTLTPGRTSFTSQETVTSTPQSSNAATYVTVSVVGALFLVTMMGVIIYICKYQSRKKTESSMSVINMEALAGMETEGTENIYT